MFMNRVNSMTDKEEGTKQKHTFIDLFPYDIRVVVTRKRTTAVYIIHT